jgi:two-component system, cell cycle response regulator
MKILVADDSSVFRKILRSLLESWQYEVVEAKDGLDALAILQSENAPRLAIIDGVMPGLSGPELCRSIRATNQDYVYMIMLSASGEEADVKRGFAEGADDYLCKSFKEFELRARLRVGVRIIETQNALLESQQALKFQATHDALTRAWNRAGILELVRKELSRVTRTGMPLSICMADLDHFKQINDQHGHLVGDEVLRRAGAQMSAVLREYDSLGRYGGEEFLVVLPGCNQHAAVGIAERLRGTIGGQPLLTDPCVLSVTISLGVCEWKQGMEANQLLSRADAALYRAKHLGRNRVECSSPDLDLSAHAKVSA